MSRLLGVFPYVALFFCIEPLSAGFDAIMIGIQVMTGMCGGESSALARDGSTARAAGRAKSCKQQQLLVEIA